jgi:hypothetical protein
MSHQMIKFETFICPDLCLTHVRGRLRSASPSPFLLTGLHSIGCKCKLINFNQYDLRLYTGSAFLVAMYCFVPTFQKEKFCGVSSGAIVEVGCAAFKKRLRNTVLDQWFSKWVPWNPEVRRTLIRVSAKC